MSSLPTNRTDSTVMAGNHADDHNQANALINSHDSSISTLQSSVTKLQGIFINVKDYGATGDGSTNDGAAIQSAISAMPANGATLYFPPGTYLTNSAALSGIPSGSTIMGAGRSASWIKQSSGTHNMFEFANGTTYITIKSLRLSNANTSGHLLAPQGSFNQGYIQDVRLAQSNPAKSIWKQGNFGYYYNSWRDCYCYHDGTTSVPMFDFTSATTSVHNANSWERITVETTSAATAYVWDFATSAAADFLYTNYLRDITCEITNGGVCRMLTCNSFILENIDIYDLTTTVNDLFYVGAHATGALTSRKITFRNISRAGGTLGSGLNDIKLQTSKATNTTIENCNKTVLTGFTVDLGTNTNVAIINSTNMTISNMSANNTFQTDGLMSYVNQTGNYSATNRDNVITASALATITLPTAVGIPNKTFTIKRTAASNNTTVNTTSSQTIDGALTKTLGSQYASITVVSDGANWNIISQMGTVT